MRPHPTPATCIAERLAAPQLAPSSSKPGASRPTAARRSSPGIGLLVRTQSGAAQRRAFGHPHRRRAPPAAARRRAGRRRRRRRRVVRRARRAGGLCTGAAWPRPRMAKRRDDEARRPVAAPPLTAASRPPCGPPIAIFLELPADGRQEPTSPSIARSERAAAAAAMPGAAAGCRRWGTRHGAPRRGDGAHL